MTKSLDAMAKGIHDPPKGRSEAEWLDVLYYLAKFDIRGGWTPGRYHVAFQAQNCHQAGCMDLFV